MKDTKLTLINVVVRETKTLALFVEVPINKVITTELIENKLAEIYNNEFPTDFHWWIKDSRDGSFLE